MKDYLESMILLITGSAELNQTERLQRYAAVQALYNELVDLKENSVDETSRDQFSYLKEVRHEKANFLNLALGRKTGYALESSFEDHILHKLRKVMAAISE